MHAPCLTLNAHLRVRPPRYRGGRGWLALAVLALLLTACENSPDVLGTIPQEDSTAAAASPHDAGPAPIAEATTYACAGGDGFMAVPMDDGASIELVRNDETMTLERVESSMGAKYVNGTTEVWISADGAFVVEDEVMVLADCAPAP